MLEQYEQSRRQLRAVAARYVGDDAEDVVQEAFLNALRYGNRFRGDSTPRTWLHRVVVNAALDHCRARNRRDHAHLGYGSHPAMAQAAFEDALSIRMALRQLTPAQRRVFVMYDVLGHTHDEIGGLLGIPTGTSKGRLAEARRRLQRALSRSAPSRSRLRARRPLRQPARLNAWASASPMPGDAPIDDGSAP